MAEILLSILLLTGMVLAAVSLIVAMQWTKPVKTNSHPVTLLFASMIFMINGLQILWFRDAPTKTISHTGEAVDNSYAAQFLLLFDRNDFYYAFVGLFAVISIAAAFVCYKKRASQFVKAAS